MEFQSDLCLAGSTNHESKSPVFSVFMKEKC